MPISSYVFYLSQQKLIYFLKLLNWMIQSSIKIRKDFNASTNINGNYGEQISKNKKGVYWIIK